MKKIIFVHIPKTAGTTLREIVYNQFNEKSVAPLYNEKQYMTVDEFVTMPPAHIQKAKAIIGHFPFGIHKELNLSAREYKYATLIRDPFKRTLSLYNHLRNHQLANRNVDLITLLKEPIGVQFRNRQSRLISGVKSLNIRDEELFDRAINNIEKHFAFVGLTERFDDSLLLATKLLGWQLRPYQNQNVATQWPNDFKTEVTDSPKLTALLKESNNVDQQVYDYVSKKFSDQIAKYFPDFEQTLLTYQNFKNSVANTRCVGNLGALKAKKIQGWAKIEDSGNQAKVRVKINGQHEFTTVADLRRTDLLNQHFTGRCGFQINLPSNISLKEGDVVEAHVINFNETKLSNSPRVFRVQSCE